MHPYMQYQLMDTRIADMRSQAGRDRIARAARRAQQQHAAQPTPRPSGVLHHLLAALFTSYGQRLRPGPVAPQLPDGRGA